MTTRLRTEELTAGYGGKAVLNELSLDFPDGKVTSIVGPNACGKSTLLKCLARLIKPSSGEVLLDGRAIHKQKTKAVAKTIALLPQSAEAPAGMRVVDLVARGRTPHQSPIQQWSKTDDEVVAQALENVGLSNESNKLVASLSGGQRQRAWIAMVLAQQTDILLLDEPTTFLDLRHQIDTLKLVRELQAERGMTVVMVLHDINLATRFSDRIVALRDGMIVCQGKPENVVTPKNIKAIYDLEAKVTHVSPDDQPHVIPL